MNAMQVMNAMNLTVKVTVTVGTSTVDSHATIPMEPVNLRTPDSVLNFATQTVNDTISQTGATALSLNPATSAAATAVDDADIVSRNGSEDGNNQFSISAKDAIKLKIVPEPKLGDEFEIIFHHCARVSNILEYFDSHGRVLEVYHGDSLLGAYEQLRHCGVKDGDTVSVKVEDTTT